MRSASTVAAWEIMSEDMFRTRFRGQMPRNSSRRTLRACTTITSCPNSLNSRLTEGECIPVSNATRQRGMPPNTSCTACDGEHPARYFQSGRR